MDNAEIGKDLDKYRDKMEVPRGLGGFQSMFNLVPQEPMGVEPTTSRVRF